jgi:hypothetical protein
LVSIISNPSCACIDSPRAFAISSSNSAFEAPRSASGRSGSRSSSSVARYQLCVLSDFPRPLYRLRARIGPAHQAEVEQLRAERLADEDVLGLEIAVDEASPVNDLDGVEDRQCVAREFIHWNGAVFSSVGGGAGGGAPCAGQTGAASRMRRPQVGQRIIETRILYRPYRRVRTRP